MNTLAAYNAVAAATHLPTMHAGAYEAGIQTITDPEAVWVALAALTPTQGWLQFQSHQCTFSDGLPERHGEWGLLLAAEAVTADEQSLALRTDGTGGWRLVHYRHHGEGDRLWDEVAHVAHAASNQRLRYRRYWRHDNEQGYVQERACFVGFE